MTDETIAAVYDTQAHAEAAVQALKAANVPSDAITTHTQGTVGGTVSGTGTETGSGPGFWSTLFGGDVGHDEGVYGRSVEQGGTVVMVRAPQEHVASVAQILERFEPIDIDERATSYGLTQTGTTSMSGAGTTAAPLPVAGQTTRPATAVGAADEKIQLAAEQLKVGKRLVNQGTTRVRRFVVETPVEEQVSLHSERVDVERRPVTDGRPVTNADFTDKVVEFTESAEEAVVSKEARVVEEVAIHKDAADRVETVRDTVRHQEVEIEKVPGAAQTTTTTTGTTPVKPTNKTL